MLKPISTEIEKLMFLRDVVIPFVKEREKEGKVDLGSITNMCGAPSCLAGWAYHHFGKELGCRPHMSAIDALHEVLGTDGGYGLFASLKWGGTLDDRAKRIDRIIERKIAEAQRAE